MQQSTISSQILEWIIFETNSLDTFVLTSAITFHWPNFDPQNYHIIWRRADTNSNEHVGVPSRAICIFINLAKPGNARVHHSKRFTVIFGYRHPLLHLSITLRYLATSPNTPAHVCTYVHTDMMISNFNVHRSRSISTFHSRTRCSLPVCHIHCRYDSPSDCSSLVTPFVQIVENKATL